MKLREILDGVCAVIHQAFPERYVYIQTQPQDFERPSFFLEVVTTRTERQNIGTAETIVYLTLTIHEPLDLVRRGDQLTVLDDMDRVMELFAMEILPVGERMLPVSAENGGQDGGEGYIDLEVTVRDGVGYDPEEGLPVIEEVKTSGVSEVAT